MPQRRTGSCLLALLVLFLVAMLLCSGCLGSCRGRRLPRRHAELAPVPVQLCAGPKLAAPIADECDVLEISRCDHETRLVFYRKVRGQRLEIFDERWPLGGYQLVAVRGGYDVLFEDEYWESFRRVHCGQVLQTESTLDDFQAELFAQPPEERRRLLEPLLIGHYPQDSFFPDCECPED